MNPLPGQDGEPPTDGDLDQDAAAGALGVDVGRISAMVEEGLLHPVGGTDDELRFSTAEVEALRLQGG